ncbi:hypothetical protein ACFXKG_34175 [Streptomyces sp. NPDC059255]|uniref:hypothetical protein n=1 Tax=Streptomyces sp. NPDC059255 TaxID=3346793 RepID=UPI0036A2CDBA
MNDHRTHRFLGTALPALLVAGALVGGSVFVGAVVDGADRSAPTTVWAESRAKPPKDPAGDIGRGRADTDLTRKLLPVPPGYLLGPDIGEYGNDTELTGKKAIELVKAVGADYSAAVRQEVYKEIDRMGIEGLALRSYRLKGGNGQGSLTADVSLVAFKDRATARSWYEVASQRPGASKGPVIEGSKHSACFLEPGSDVDGIESVTCVAYEGGTAVTVAAEGMKPLNRFTLTELVKDQLDHLASPGESV